MTEEKQPKQQKKFRAWSRVWSRSFGQSGVWADDLSSPIFINILFILPATDKKKKKKNLLLPLLLLNSV